MSYKQRVIKKIIAPSLILRKLIFVPKSNMTVKL